MVVYYDIELLLKYKSAYQIEKAVKNGEFYKRKIRICNGYRILQMTIIYLK